MIKMNPTTRAVPNACTVSATGQPHRSVRTHAANCVFSSASSTLFPSRPIRKLGARALVERESGQADDAQNAGIKGKNNQRDFKLPHLLIPSGQRKGSSRPQTITPAHANRTTAPITFAEMGALSP